jgi:hypothetical protein
MFPLSFCELFGVIFCLIGAPANQAWATNNAWAHYSAQIRQVQVPNVSTGTSGSAFQHNAVTP